MWQFAARAGEPHAVDVRLPELVAHVFGDRASARHPRRIKPVSRGLEEHSASAYVRGVAHNDSIRLRDRTERATGPNTTNQPTRQPANESTADRTSGSTAPRRCESRSARVARS